MPPTAATTGYGVVMKRGADGIVEITDMSQLPGAERDAIDVTTFISPDMYREFIMGLINGGTPEITVNYRPKNASHKQLITDLTAVPAVKQTYNFELSDDFNSPSVISADMLVTGFTPMAAKDGALTARFKFQVTGPVTFPTGSE